ncbi:hypothetical protein [Leptospira interrogans]|uniref:hypothetical protein n=1 Tax=Leptospira interrogans TaxID=173 RepID=UPI0002BA0DE2|nr:hypothetical protein [Leptospira interrogans]MCR8647690.1 hypothetical protein [Leptospira interrogans serovar Bataviae]OAM85448.1 hypothetical protein A1343_18050 [Leptospira interrogans serovar Bataviae]QOI36866.1 hypothetical protein Lepto1548_00175 [Leptospira interrogans serovar Bataviae]QOI38356.1 hypothetical protein Lepto1548_08740 [Leptospira interrogans serovar Bataviae]QYY60461.1 hypothetical protein GR153_000170 [Leptospira interrogans serovar Bataviae]
MKLFEPEIKGEWHVLRLPAILEDGTSLWPERFKIENVLKLRARIGERLFNSLYQQTPLDVSERIFSDPKFEEAPKDIKIFAFWDPAFRKAEKKKDFNAFTAGGSSDGKFYVISGEIWRTKLSESYDRVEKLCKKFHVSKLFIEDNKGEDALEIEMTERGILSKGITSVGDKDFRIQQYAKLNWDKIRFSNLVSQKYLKQILEYSDVVERHDDAPDSLAGLIRETKFGPQSKGIKNRISFLEMLLNEGRW